MCSKFDEDTPKGSVSIILFGNMPVSIQERVHRSSYCELTFWDAFGGSAQSYFKCTLSFSVTCNVSCTDYQYIPLNFPFEYLCQDMQLVGVLHLFLQLWAVGCQSQLVHNVICDSALKDKGAWLKYVISLCACTFYTLGYELKVRFTYF